LLGSAIDNLTEEPFHGRPVPWDDPEAAAAALREDARRFQQEAASRPWSVIWAAGAATTSAAADQAGREITMLDGLLQALSDHTPSGSGTFFLSSSAGGVYAGSAGAPFDAATPVAPLSHYGALKVAQEALAMDVLATVCPVVIGRFSNIYGPGQNLAKQQGLISRLALAAATRQPINVFVPLDTIRDYIYVNDAAAACHAAVESSQRTPSTEPHVLVIASGQPATVSQVIRTMGQVTKRRVPVALGSHHSARAQASDLRLTPTGPLPRTTPLPAGMKSVFLDILDRIRERPLNA
jgi:UDP-glucose 4-epimerase